VTVQQPTLPQDSLRAILDDIFSAPEYQWDLRRHPLQFLLDLWARVYRWFDALEADHPVTYYVLIALLSGVLVAILAHFGYLIWRALRPRSAPVDPAAAAAPGRRGAQWYLSEARRLAGKGRFAESLAHRFRALILDLDRRHAVAFHPSKTPAEYVREAKLDQSGRAVLSGLVAQLYRHLFGGASCDADTVNRFDEQAAVLGAHLASD
jgi:hypothetical protein